MIAKLSGILDSVSENTLILDVNGVGYLVHASARTLSQAGQAGDTLCLLIETIIREDAFNLYGFQDVAEQEWFRLLTSVQGVGAKAGLAILSVTPADQLTFAIMSGDKTAFTRASGVGPKLATRILTELKDKAGKVDLSPAPPKGKAGDISNAPINVANTDNDAVSALVNLGYARSDAYAAVARAKAENDNDDLQTLIRLALKDLSS